MILGEKKTVMHEASGSLHIYSDGNNSGFKKKLQEIFMTVCIHYFCVSLVNL